MICLDCIDAANVEKNTWYISRGGDQWTGGSITVLDCGIECYHDKKCKFWTFFEPTYECTLNSGGLRKVQDKESVSGLPVCPNSELGNLYQLNGKI